jgi:hypothetical protein
VDRERWITPNSSLRRVTDPTHREDEVVRPIDARPSSRGVHSLVSKREVSLRPIPRPDGRRAARRVGLRRR